MAEVTRFARLGYFCVTRTSMRRLRSRPSGVSLRATGGVERHTLRFEARAGHAERDQVPGRIL
jgi:hypothetical protein